MLRAGGPEKTFFRGSGVYRHQGDRAHQPVSDIRGTRADADEARRTHRSGTAGGLRHGSHVRAVAARAPEPHECRHHQRLRQSASDFSDPSKRSVSHLHVDGRRYRRDTSRAASASAIPPSSRPFPMPATDRRARSHRNHADAGLSRSAERNRSWPIPELRTRNRCAHPRAHRPQRSPAGRRGRLERAIRARAERDRRPHPLSRAAARASRARRQAHRAVPRPRRSLDAAYLWNAARSSLLDAAATFSRARLAYRDVASSTNRLSLIAAVLPAGVVTTHSLFCLKTMLSADNQAFLCAMFNSYVANYLVRQVMTTHLGSTTVEALRVPKPRLRLAAVRGNRRPGARAAAGAWSTTLTRACRRSRRAATG